MQSWVIPKMANYIWLKGLESVLVRDGKLLVQRDRDGSEYALPGGHIKIGETTVDGIVMLSWDGCLLKNWQS